MVVTSIAFVDMDTPRLDAILAAAGYNFSLLLRWLEALLRALIQLLVGARSTVQIA